ncbi:uridine diphosphate-N-acetylglucosamine-binding protein YvcK [Micrococcales bacterium 31B]|nr:uridine diphosphate-N-acetylglucosamine-binding protein YvcK [Micrococcales bacterium 31B]
MAEAKSRPRWAGRSGHVVSPKVVACGGGHGLYASLTALRHLSDRLTAVVTVADNGGSSGRLRTEFDILPPGDLRMALAALCDDTEWGHVWSDVLQHRFTSEGDMNGHAVGNILITALWEILEDPVQGLDWVGRLLGARGRVLPMAVDPLDIVADVELPNGELVQVRGQAQVAKTEGRVRHIALVPENPTPCKPALKALRDADWVVMGPGSWYTSVLTHLLVPSFVEAIHETDSRICLTMNLASPKEETGGLSATQHFEVFHEMSGQLKVDAVIADPTMIEDTDELADAVAARGGKLLLRQVAMSSNDPRHDPLRLAAAYRDVFGGTYSDV